jgi:hypothetical protein
MAASRTPTDYIRFFFCHITREDTMDILDAVPTGWTPDSTSLGASFWHLHSIAMALEEHIQHLFSRIAWAAGAPPWISILAQILIAHFRRPHGLDDHNEKSLTDEIYTLHWLFLRLSLARALQSPSSHIVRWHSSATFFPTYASFTRIPVPTAPGRIARLTIP